MSNNGLPDAPCIYGYRVYIDDGKRSSTSAEIMAPSAAEAVTVAVQRRYGRRALWLWAAVGRYRIFTPAYRARGRVREERVLAAAVTINAVTTGRARQLKIF